MVLEACRPKSEDWPDPFYSAVEEVRALGEAGRKALLTIASQDDDGDAACAVDLLRQLRDDRVVPVARAILRSRKANVWLRSQALYVVGDFSVESAFETAMKAFSDAAAAFQVRSAAVYALGRLARPEGRQALLHALATEERHPLQAEMIIAVGVPGHTQAVPVLRALADTPSLQTIWSQRVRVVTSLIRIGTSESRRAAMEVVLSTVDELQRADLSERARRELFVHRSGLRDPAEIAEVDTLLARLPK